MSDTPLQSDVLRTAFTTLATLPLASDETIPAILALIADTLGVDAAYYARFDGDVQRIETTYDPGQIGVQQGMVVEMDQTFCQTMYNEALTSLVVENSLEDPRYAQLAPTRVFGIRAYSGVSLYRPEGLPYGSLCTLTKEPRQIAPDEVALLTLAGRIVMQVIETRENEQRLRTLVSLAPIGAAVLDDGGNFEAVNAHFAAMLGYTPEELIGQPFLVLFPPQQWVTQQQAHTRRVATAARGTRGEHLLTRSGAPRLVRIASMQFPGTAGRAQGLWYVTDLTMEREQEARRFLLTGQDTLTKLETRPPFIRRLSAMLLSGTPVTVLYGDLDAFFAVNDTLGYETGDQAIAAVAERLRANVGEGNFVARLGSDEFAVLLADITDPAEIAPLARNLLAQVAAPLVVEKQWLRVSLSLGIAHSPQDGEEGGQLMLAAEGAMRYVKRTGKHNIAFASDGASNTVFRGA